MNRSLLRAHWLCVPVTVGFAALCLVLPTFGQDEVAVADEGVSKIATPLSLASGSVASDSESSLLADSPAPTVIQTSSERLTAEPEHPLASTVRYARRGLARVEQDIRDYSCKLVKRERIGGRLKPYDTIAMKVRHDPFSVYMRFLGPKKARDRECLYVASQNDDLLLAHEGQGLMGRLPSISLDPLGSLAMSGQRYPITEVGIHRLAERLLATAIHDSNYGEAEVKLFPKVKVKGREAMCIQITHPTRRSHFRYHIGRVFVDSELQVPIRYAGYLWPKKPGGKPVLDEEYTYLDLKINNGFTDLDFDRQNPDYNF